MILRTLIALLSLAPPATAHEVGHDPSDTNAFLRHAFEDRDCIMTRDQLLALYQVAGFDPSAAQQAVTAVAQRDDIDLIAPATYRYTGSPNCAF